MEILTIYRRVPVCVNWRVTEEGGIGRGGLEGRRGKREMGRRGEGGRGPTGIYHLSFYYAISLSTGSTIRGQSYVLTSRLGAIRCEEDNEIDI